MTSWANKKIHMAASKELAKILAEKDPEKYKAIIERAANNGYHDHKFDKIPGHPEYGVTACPKMQLVSDLSAFPELNDIRQRVMDGEWDDHADAEDAEEMRGWLMDENVPDEMFKQMGFRVPSSKERRQWKMKKTFN
jgi:hypothetical protein